MLRWHSRQHSIGNAHYLRIVPPQEATELSEYVSLCWCFLAIFLLYPTESYTLYWCAAAKSDMHPLFFRSAHQRFCMLCGGLDSFTQCSSWALHSSEAL